jgi:hypothetical protein
MKKSKAAYVRKGKINYASNINKSSGLGQVAGSCECGHEPSGSLKRGEFLD